MTDDKPFFTAEDFPAEISDLSDAMRAARIANAKVAPLVEENRRLKLDMEHFDRCVDDNARLKESSRLACEAVIEMGDGLRGARIELSDLKSLNATYRGALENAEFILDELGHMTKDGDVVSVKLEAWEGAMSMRDQITDLLAAGKKEGE